jgi:2,4-dihydroxyhept-2-ene-1,7-dioic acid aldolase
VQEVSIAEIAQAAGYDSLFIDLEHSSFSLDRTADICLAANLAGVSPFVRVPHECGNGFVQRVLDGDAKGIVVPHVRNAGTKSPSPSMQLQSIDRWRFRGRTQSSGDGQVSTNRNSIHQPLFTDEEWA